MTKSIFSIILLIFSTNSLFSADIKGTVKTEDGALSDAVVYIEKIEGKKFNPPAKHAVLDQVDLTFVPHVLPILVGTTVDFPNSDMTRHNVFSPSNVKKFDLGTYAPGSSKSIVFDKPGVIPLLCHVHPEMSAFIVVLETPYFGVTGENGSYKIQNIPPGKYTLVVWHEFTKRKTQTIEIGGKDVTANFIVEEK